MSTALVPTWRITVPYTATGRQHKLRMYIPTCTPAGASYTFTDRLAATVDWGDAVEGLATNLQNVMSTGTTLGDALLEELVAGIWLPRGNHTILAAFAPSAAPVLSSQWTLVLRDTNFKKMKVILLDVRVVPPAHATSVATCDAQSQFLVKNFTPAATAANPPYNWMIGRSGAFINTAPFVGLTLALNRKIRRARGLA
jgi:hypothetical protein